MIKKMSIAIICAGLLTVFFLNNCHAESPLDVFRKKFGDETTPYPQTEGYQSGNSSSEQVKFESKETMTDKPQADKSRGSGGGFLKGLISGKKKQKEPREDLETKTCPYLGTWIRQAIIVDGVNQQNKPANLVLRKDTFNSSTSVCATAGNVSVAGSRMTTTMTQSNCPGGVKPPFTVTYTCSFSKDGKTMTLATGPVKEIYARTK